ncbi:DinB family protein [Parasediminibacterium sp. JCM 36343]|uniref:DinB family protein n=1 Tax=Parasediminibacterium sp. JCM 36343 TaxID=3374279 RepID=UPI00397C58DE
MEKQIEIIKSTRQALLQFVSDLTVEQLNEIPAGFNNNIIWNLAHLMSSQQGLCYVRSGLPLFVEEKYFESYKPGTKPENVVNSEEIAAIKFLFLSTIEQFQQDYANGAFANYTLFTNRYGVNIASIEDAITFVNFHEGIHFGYIMALKRVVSRKS